jgi:integrase
MFKYAHANGYIEINPFFGLKPRKFIIPEAKSLESKGAADFLKTVHEFFPHYDLIARFAYDTGMRVGEILHQRWDDVNLESGLLKVTAHLETCPCIQCNRSLQRYGKRGWLPKTGQERYVPISRDLKAALQEVPKAERVGIVFNYSASGIERRFGRLHTKAGDPQGSPFHVFRHTMVSDMERAKVRPGVISAIVGHSVPLSTGGAPMTRHYNHAFVGELLAGMKQLTEWRDQQKIPLVEQEVEGLRMVAVA